VRLWKVAASGAAALGLAAVGVTTALAGNYDAAQPGFMSSAACGAYAITAQETGAPATDLALLTWSGPGGTGIVDLGNGTSSSSSAMVLVSRLNSADIWSESTSTPDPNSYTLTIYNSYEYNDASATLAPLGVANCATPAPSATPTPSASPTATSSASATPSSTSSSSPLIASSGSVSGSSGSSGPGGAASPAATSSVAPSPSPTALGQKLTSALAPSRPASSVSSLWWLALGFVLATALGLGTAIGRRQRSGKS